MHPQRVTAAGRFLSHAVHHAANAQHAAARRRRRSPELGVDPSIHVRLPLPGAEPPLLLRLEPNGRLLAPGFVLERRIGYGLSPGYGVRNLTRISNPGCFYTGSLRGGNGSLALSTCNGLAGFVRTERDDYLVEPLEPPRGHDPQPHLVYKRSATSGGDFPEEWLSRAQDVDRQEASSFCATKGLELRPPPTTTTTEGPVLGPGSTSVGAAVVAR